MIATKRDKKTASADWHRADIIAELHKKGISLRQLAIANGYCGTTLNNVFTRRWPRGEKIIAHALGVSAKELFPSRYLPSQKVVIPVLPKSVAERRAA